MDSRTFCQVRYRLAILNMMNDSLDSDHIYLDVVRRGTYQLNWDEKAIDSRDRGREWAFVECHRRAGIMF